MGAATAIPAVTLVWMAVSRPERKVGAIVTDPLAQLLFAATGMLLLLLVGHERVLIRLDTWIIPETKEQQHALAAAAATLTQTARMTTVSRTLNRTAKRGCGSPAALLIAADTQEKAPDFRAPDARIAPLPRTSAIVHVLETSGGPLRVNPKDKTSVFPLLPPDDVEWVDTEDGGQEKVGNGLTGSIPPELGSLTHLRVLDLSRNQMTGEIPPELGRLSRLETLRLSINRLTGPIPMELTNLSNLEFLSLHSNQLRGPIPAQLGHLSRLRSLHLGGNQLTGPIPPELGKLSQLWWLELDWNELTGPIPSDLLQLGQLDTFLYSHNLGLCAPGTTEFIAWLKGIERHAGPYCNESDVAVLDSFFRNTAGEDWTNSGGWSGDGAVSEWHGVSTDSLGRVTGLDLSGNGLTGRLPRILGQLAQLTDLRIDSNALSGRLPLELARLSLQVFHYADTELCAPVEEPFQAWLNSIRNCAGSKVSWPGARICAPPRTPGFRPG